MLPRRIFLSPVNSSTQEAHGQFSLRCHDGYELKCPSFHVTSVCVGLTRFIKLGLAYAK